MRKLQFEQAIISEWGIKSRAWIPPVSPSLSPPAPASPGARAPARSQRFHRLARFKVNFETGGIVGSRTREIICLADLDKGLNYIAC